MQKIYQCVVEGDIDGVLKEIQRVLDTGKDPQEIINEGLIKPMDEVGAKMKSGDMFVPEVLVAAAAMKEGLEMLKPLLVGEMETKGKVLIGTVAGDLHDIGKNLVRMLLESSGYEVVDLGVDVPKDKILESIEEHKPNIVGLSALLTTTMASMGETVKAINAQFKGVKTIVGGAPISQEYATEIGADGYASDAGGAVDLCNALLT
jgi:5-methyltetrahydrofolate--homocysteine methyltransferase